MSLELFYITNNTDVALIAEKYGVDRIWIDLETFGKEERQKNMNTVKSHHNVRDISKIKPLLTKSKLMVRVNPWNVNSKQEIDDVINAGADIVMLPMWMCVNEVKAFIKAVDGRAKTNLLLETKQAVDCIDEVLKLDGIDEIHIGLNDLHISYGQTFMFEPLANGTVDMLCDKFKKANIPYGFGGVASIGKGFLKSEYVIMEHYRLGSTRAILSRSFCNINTCTDLKEVEDRFKTSMSALRQYEQVCSKADENTLIENKQIVCDRVFEIVEELGNII